MQQSRLGRDIDDILLESIDETIIELLSRAVVDALYVHLQTNYSLSRNELPSRLDTLINSLEKVFGVRGSLAITKAISKKFYRKLGLGFTDNPNRTLLEYVDEAKTKLQNSASK